MTDDPAVRRDRALRTGIAAVVLLATVVGVALAASWAWDVLRPAPAEQVSSVSAPATTPEEVSTAYFTAVAAGDEAAVRRLVAPAAVPVLVEALGADLGNVASLTELKAGAAVARPPAPPAAGATPAPARPPAAPEVVVPVTYVVEYEHQIVGDNGPTQRWVVLSQDTAGGPWLIRSVRTSP